MNRIPDEWTKYIAVDPGHTAQAALLAAVPSPEAGVGNIVLIYDEVFLERQDCDQFAAAVAQKASAQRFQSFIMDAHAGRQTPMGANRTIKQQYAEAFNRYGLRSVETGSSFHNGSDDVGGRAMIVREWLMVQGDGSTKLRILRDTTPFLQGQLARYKKRVVKNETRDVPIPKNCDLVICLEYLAAADPQWCLPDEGEAPKSPAYQSYLKFVEWNKKTDRDHVDFGTPLNTQS